MPTMPPDISKAPLDLAALITAMDRVVDTVPASHGFALARANIVQELVDFDDMRTQITRFLASEPTEGIGFTTYAELGMRLGSYDTAIAMLANAAQAQPDNAMLAQFHENMLLLAGRENDAGEIASTVPLTRVPPRLTVPDEAAHQLSPQAVHGVVESLVSKAFSDGEIDAGLALLDATMRADALSLATLGRLAYFVCTLPDYSLGVELCERAFALAPNDWEVNFDLAAAYELAGDVARARAKWAQAPLSGSILTASFSGTGQPVRVLQILTATHGRAPRHFDANTMQLSMLFTQGYDPSLPLPPHDIVYSIVADEEMSAQALDVADQIIARTTAPVINAPYKIRRTSRVEQAERLAVLPGVIIPQIAAVERVSLTAADAAAALAARGFAFPLLVRSPGFHNGLHFDLINEPEQLAPSAAAMPGDDVFVIAYHDTRGADGLTRKMRVMMIDGRLYPVHLAISNHWKVHYYSSQNDEHAAYRLEEERFLTDMAGYLGSSAVAALEAVARATDVDYGGIDFGIARDGKVVVFEANACMSIFLPNDDPKWDYRRGPMTAAIDAIKAMLISRARQPNDLAGARR